MLLFLVVLVLLIILYYNFPVIHCQGDYRKLNDAHYFHKKKDLIRGKESSDAVRRITDLLIPILEKNNIIYWLDSGSLLGAFRNGDIIKHDDDADIVTTREGFLKMKELSLPYPLFWADMNELDEDKGVLKAKIVDAESRLACDIVVFKEYGNNMGATPYIWTCNGCNGEDFRIPNEWIYPLRKCKFGNVIATCPNETELYLKFMYGKDLSSDRGWDDSCDAWMPL